MIPNHGPMSTSIIGNYAYAESNLHFFKADNKIGRTLFTLVFLLMMLQGSQVELKQVWATADMAFGFMTIINVIAIVWLTPTVLRVSKDYFEKKRNGSFASGFNAKQSAVQGSIEEKIWSEENCFILSSIEIVYYVILSFLQ